MRSIFWKSICAFACLIGFGHFSIAQEQKEVRPRELLLGVIAPLSGDVAAWGSDVQKSLRFAQRELSLPIRIIFEDDRCTGKNAVAAAHKLVAVDKVDFAMVVCSESLLSSAPIFERARVTVISPTATAAAISQAGDYIFRTFPNDGQAVKLLYGYLAQHQRHIGVITEQRGYSAEVRYSFEAEAKDGELSVSYVDFLSDEGDIGPQLLRMKSQNVDSIFLNVNSEPRLLSALKRTREILGQIQVYGLYLPGSLAFRSVAGPAADGIIYVDAPSPETFFTPEGRDLLQRFEQENGPLQSLRFVFGATFEAYRLFGQACCATGEVKNRPDLRALLYKKQFTGMFGSYRFNTDGDIEGVRHSIKRIEEGEDRDQVP